MEAHEAYKASRWLEAAQKYEAAVNGDPTLARRALLPGEQLR